MKKVVESTDENLVMIFNISGKIHIHKGINANIINNLSLIPNLFYSVMMNRVETEIEKHKIIFIDVIPKDDLELN